MLPVAGPVPPPALTLFALVAASLLLQEVTLPPTPRGFAADRADMVVDAAGVIPADQVERINRLIFAVKARSGGEIVVVTMPDISGREAGDIALRIGREWKVGEAAAIGDRARNAGVVVLVVPKESASDGRGQVSIQTGQGAEGFITDGTAGDIRREAIPWFQRQDYGSAIELITARLAQRYAMEFGFSLDSALVDDRFTVDRRQAGDFPPELLLVLFVIMLFLLTAMANARRHGRRGCLYAIAAEAMRPPRRSSWGGGGGFGGGSWGGGGGGFGGFGGGGGFSGGGSSGSW